MSGALSADTDDLTTEKGRKEAEDFFDYLIWSVKQEIFEPAAPVMPEPAHVKVTVSETADAL